MSNIYDFTLPEVDNELFISQLSHKSVEMKTIISNTLSTPQTFIQKCDE